MTDSERIARYIETVMLPAYSAANEEFDGPTVTRAEVYADLRLLVEKIRYGLGETDDVEIELTT
jgi:hypothetical protein